MNVAPPQQFWHRKTPKSKRIFKRRNLIVSAFPEDYHAACPSATPPPVVAKFLFCMQNLASDGQPDG
jgi:hypothetical protein